MAEPLNAIPDILSAKINREDYRYMIADLMEQNFKLQIYIHEITKELVQARERLDKQPPREHTDGSQ